MTEPPARPEPSPEGDSVEPTGSLEPPRGHRRRLAYLVGAAALVVIVVVALVLVFTLGGDDGPTSSPRKVVTALLADAGRNDVTAAAKLVCPTFVVGSQIDVAPGGSNAVGSSGLALLASLHPADATVTDVREFHSAAAVDATVALGGQPTALSFSTEHQNGKWLVCAVQQGVRTATGAPTPQPSAASATASSDEPSFSTPGTPSFPGTSGFPGTPSLPTVSGPPTTGSLPVISSRPPGANGSPAVS